jgi:hypothetical protein
VPEIIDPVFAKTSTKRSLSMTAYACFGLVFTKTLVYKFGHRRIRKRQRKGRRRKRQKTLAVEEKNRENSVARVTGEYLVGTGFSRRVVFTP